jgi:hypothetical protein
MDIPALSTGLSQINLQQQVGIAVEKLAMNASTQQGNQLVNLVNASTPHPTLGNNIDLKA